MPVPVIPLLIIGGGILAAVLGGKKASAATTTKHPINVPGFPVVPDGCGPSGDLDNPYKALVDTAMAKETDPAKLDELAAAFETATPPCPATGARIRARAAALRAYKPPTPGAPPPKKATSGPGIDRPPVAEDGSGIYFPVGRKQSGYDVWRTSDDRWWIFPSGYGGTPIPIEKPVGTGGHPGYTATSRYYTHDDGTKDQIWTSNSDNKDYIFVFGAPVRVYSSSPPGGFDT